MAYKLMKRIIARDVKNGTLNRAATMDKLDAFLAADRLTATEYQELVAMMPDEQAHRQYRLFLCREAVQTRPCKIGGNEHDL